jgi:hypothetical protein
MDSDMSLDSISSQQSSLQPSTSNSSNLVVLTTGITIEAATRPQVRPPPQPQSKKLPQVEQKRVLDEGVVGTKKKKKKGTKTKDDDCFEIDAPTSASTSEELSSPARSRTFGFHERQDRTRNVSGSSSTIVRFREQQEVTRHMHDPLVVRAPNNPPLLRYPNQNSQNDHSNYSNDGWIGPTGHIGRQALTVVQTVTNVIPGVPLRASTPILYAPTSQQPPPPPPPPLHFRSTPDSHVVTPQWFPHYVPPQMSTPVLPPVDVRPHVGRRGLGYAPPRGRALGRGRGRGRGNDTQTQAQYDQGFHQQQMVYRGQFGGRGGHRW